ncbi:CDS_ID OB0857 [hydrothermal vent metagenome]|uniref:CDS_ID OB0857 n=1 Tax=hydrothermal vent metagenome TaxID=652676 RepID=A0A3B0XAJ0_9ZZZZ
MKNTKLVRFVNEDRLGGKWLSFYRETIDSYKQWFLNEGEFNRPSYQACHNAIKEHMPELEAMWLSMIELTEADDLEARLLSFYCPSPYISGCSQAVWSKYNPVLVRNYDYDLALCEMRIMKTRWFETEVIASLDSLWGVLDGMNEHGLAVSLSFGGTRERGVGFGIPVILRYILEFCQTTQQAVDVLQRVPTHMTYNVTILDAAYNVSTVEISPNNITRVSHIPIAVNHQGEYELTDYAIFSKSHERKKFLIDKLYDPTINIESFIDSFEYTPLFANNYEEGFGTIYTAIYNPTLKATEFRWPFNIRRYKSFVSFEEEAFWVTY